MKKRAVYDFTIDDMDEAKFPNYGYEKIVDTPDGPILVCVDWAGAMSLFGWCLCGQNSSGGFKNLPFKDSENMVWRNPEEALESALRYLNNHYASRKKAMKKRASLDWQAVPGGYGLYECITPEYTFLMQEPAFAGEPYLLDVEEAYGSNMVVDAEEFGSQAELEEFICSSFGVC